MTLSIITSSFTPTRQQHPARQHSQLLSKVSRKIQMQVCIKSLVIFSPIGKGPTSDTYKANRRTSYVYINWVCSEIQVKPITCIFLTKKIYVVQNRTNDGFYRFVQFLSGLQFFVRFFHRAIHVFYWNLCLFGSRLDWLNRPVRYDFNYLGFFGI